MYRHTSQDIQGLLDELIKIKHAQGKYAKATTSVQSLAAIAYEFFVEIQLQAFGNDEEELDNLF